MRRFPVSRVGGGTRRSKEAVHRSLDQFLPLHFVPTVVTTLIHIHLVSHSRRVVHFVDALEFP